MYVRDCWPKVQKLTMSSKPPNLPGTTFLTSTQAAQILEKLKVIKNVEGQTIKIQTIQTNPQTGAKHIVAIPIQSAPAAATGSPNLSISPMKRGGEGASHILTQGRTIKISSPRIAGQSGQVSIMKPHQNSIQSVQQSQSLHTVASIHSVAGVQSLQPTLTTTANLQRVTLTPQKGQQQTVVGTALAPRFPRQNLHFESAGGTKRPAESDSPLEFNDAKRRKTEKGGKGLRHFSMKVCEKVKAKGTTSYNEVADELVQELTDPRCQSPSDPQYDQKNIRRRVYDALNVLMAMNIISKEKKEIRWLGLPTNSIQEANTMETEKAEKIERIKTKTKQLQDLILQQIAFKNLVERNRELEKVSGAPTPNSAIQLPFIIVGTSKKTVIDCSISNDKMEYLFNFDNTFEIHDDMEVLKKMKMTLGLENGTVDEAGLRRARGMVPHALHSYVDQLAKSGVNAFNSLLPKVSAPSASAVVKCEVGGPDYDMDEEGVDEESE